MKVSFPLGVAALCFPLSWPALSSPLTPTTVIGTSFASQDAKIFIGLSCQYRIIGDLFGTGIFLGPQGYVVTDGVTSMSGLGIVLGKSFDLRDMSLEFAVADNDRFASGAGGSGILSASIGLFNNKNGFGMQIEFPFSQPQRGLVTFSYKSP